MTFYFGYHWQMTFYFGNHCHFTLVTIDKWHHPPVVSFYFGNHWLWTVFRYLFRNTRLDEQVLCDKRCNKDTFLCNSTALQKFAKFFLVEKRWQILRRTKYYLEARLCAVFLLRNGKLCVWNFSGEMQSKKLVWLCSCDVIKRAFVSQAVFLGNFRFFPPG